MTSRPLESSSPATAHLYLREDRLRQSYEAMMLAWRALNAECETLLRERGLGPAHHRILFLTASHPGITPGVLLGQLGITKQSLGRALSDLRDRQLLLQEEDRHDRRRRPLRLTESGEVLERELFLMIRDVMTRAFREAGVNAVDGFRRVLAPLQSDEGGALKMNEEHILVVDDDPRLLRLLHRYLAEQGYRVSTAVDAAEARQILQRVQPDAIVLDVTMPGEDGLSLTESLRKQGITLPILLLTARGEPSDRISGLEAGADDYLGKPFEPRELLLRLRAHLRRMTPVASGIDEAPDMLRLGELEFDAKRGLLSGPDGPVHLTGGESALLSALTKPPGVVMSREAIAKALEMDESGERAVDVQVTRLRRRIEVDPREPRFLHTVRGKGYVLKPGR